MTTIIAVENDKGVTFAWDTQVSWGSRSMTGCVKVFQNGPVTFGAAGSGRSADILEHMSIPDRKEYEPGFDNKHWVIRTLVPAIIREFKDVDAVESGAFDSEGSVIFHVGGLTGYLGANMCFVEDEKGIYAVGSGSPYALGALSAGATPKKAVEIARDWDMYTGGEVQTLTIKKETK